MTRIATLAAAAALCTGLAACAQPHSEVGYPSSNASADPYRYSRYDGSPYNYSDGSDPNFEHYRGSTAYGGYQAVPTARTYYDPYYDPYYDRPYYRQSYVEPGWYDRYGRYHPPRYY
jgi:hypothetical protein